MSPRRELSAQSEWDKRTRLACAFITQVTGTVLSPQSTEAFIALLDDGIILCDLVGKLSTHLNVPVHHRTPLGKLRQQLQNLNGCAPAPRGPPRAALRRDRQE